MANLRYLLPRMIRHFMPDPIVRVFLKRGFIIRPGPETRVPLDALKRYQDALDGFGATFAGKRVMLFGYGGNFAVGCHLLKLGATHVVFIEKEGFPNNRKNLELMEEFAEYLALEGGVVSPRPDCGTLLYGDIRTIAKNGVLPPVDMVLSSSVYEHLDDVEGITAALALLTLESGAQLHFIDLRDHFFKYPFEMLCYSETIWRNWLNPTSNHNRYRLPDYERVFKEHFQEVEVKVTGRDPDAFEKARLRIRPEFISGDPAVDAITLATVFVASPKNARQGYDYSHRQNLELS